MTMTVVSNEILGEALIAVGKRLKSGKCEISQEKADSLLSELEDCMDIPISKEQAYTMLGISRSTFDAKVAAGELPEGRHRRGFKEKVYYKSEITKYIENGQGNK